MRKRNIVMTAVPFAIAGTVGAFAFITQSVSTTSGSGTTATPQALTGQVQGVPTGFAPGDHATIKLHVVNKNAFAVKVSGTTFAVTTNGTCDPGSFTIAQPTGVADVPSAAKAADGTVTDGTADIAATLTFNNLPDTNQNGCLDKILTVTASAS